METQQHTETNTQHQTTPQSLAASSFVQNMRSDHICFGLIGEDRYRSYGPAEPNDHEYVLKQAHKSFALSDLANEQDIDRLKMWENYYRSMSLLSLKDSSASVVDNLYQVIKELSPLALSQLESQPKTGLGLHLEEISLFCKNFYLNNNGSSRFPELLSDREAQLLSSVIAPLHDLLKYLGTPKAQIMADHEIMTAELIKEQFVDKTVVLNGRKTTLTKKDVEFIALVIADHENIYKELGRSEWSLSDNSIERAKALFFVADTLTGAIVSDDGICWRIDYLQLDKRFIDLYFRHIDPVAGKVFRPEWALFAIKDLSTTINTLCTHGAKITGANSQVSATQTLINGGCDGIIRALVADNKRRLEGKNLLSADQLDQITTVKQQLEAMSNA